MPGLSAQYWFKLWLGAMRQQAITWINVEQDLCYHMSTGGISWLLMFVLNEGHISSCIVSKPWYIGMDPVQHWFRLWLAVALFSLTSYCKRTLDRGADVCTDIPSEWWKPCRQSLPVPAEDLDFPKNKGTPAPVLANAETFKPVLPLSDHQRKSMKDKVLHLLRSTQKRAVLLKAYPGPRSDDHDAPMPPQIKLLDYELAMLFKAHQSVAHFTSFDDFIKLCSNTLFDSTGAEIAQIPQRSEAWKQQRLNRVTTSIVRTVVHFRHYHKPQSSLMKTVTGVSSFDSKQLRLGRKIRGNCMQAVYGEMVPPARQCSMPGEQISYWQWQSSSGCLARWAPAMWLPWCITTTRKVHLQTLAVNSGWHTGWQQIPLWLLWGTKARQILALVGPNPVGNNQDPSGLSSFVVWWWQKTAYCGNHFCDYVAAGGTKK